MTDTQRQSAIKATVIENIQGLIARRASATVEIPPTVEISPELNLTEDLGLDSLEFAELSAALEDELGRDPFSEGLIPETVEELLDFYSA